jgi:transformation/transcription domain-associated protein
MPHSWVVSRQLIVTRSLVSILELASGGDVSNVAMIIEAASALITRCAGQEDPATVEFLCRRLSHPNERVRRIADAAMLHMIQTGADTTKRIKFSWILEGSSLQQLAPKGSGNALLVQQQRQEGRLQALAFCLRQLTGLLSEASVVQEVIRMCDQCVALLEVPEEQQHREGSVGLASRSQGLVFLGAVWASLSKIVSMEAEPWTGLRHRLLPVLIKGVVHRSDAIVDASVSCLSALAGSSVIPEDAWNALLADLISRVVVPNAPLKDESLSAVIRILRVAPRAFPDSLSLHILKQLQAWHETAAGMVATQPVLESVRSQMCAGLLDVLSLAPLAPSSAAVVLPAMVRCVVVLEGRAGNSLETAYRAPLVVFLNRDPGAACVFFLQHLVNDANLAQLFLLIVENPAAQPLRQWLAANPHALLGALFRGAPLALVKEEAPSVDTKLLAGDNQGGTAAASSAADTILVSIVAALVKEDPKWLAAHPELLAVLVQIWRRTVCNPVIPVPPLVADVPLRLVKKLLRCFVNYLDNNDQEVNVLFDMIQVWSTRLADDLQWLQRYLEQQLGAWRSERKVMILWRFVELFDATGGHRSVPLATATLKKLIMPLIVSSVCPPAAATSDNKQHDETERPEMGLSSAASAAPIPDDVMFKFLQSVAKHLGSEGG